jgi:hypothetical protein
MPGPARRAPAPGERDHADAIGEGLVNRVEMPDACHDIARVMRDLLDAIRVVVTGPDQAQLPDAHVLHGPDDGTDVDRILRFVQNDRDGRQE